MNQNIELQDTTKSNKYEIPHLGSSDEINSFDAYENSISSDDRRTADSGNADEEEYAPKRKSYQLRALFRKQISLQLRQKASNIIQILTPIIGLSIIVIIKALAEQQIYRVASTVQLEIPFIFNLPYSKIGRTGLGLNISNCDQWYLYDFDDNATSETIAFLGYNNGTPIGEPESTGMLSAGDNILTTECSDYNTSVPYFIKANESLNTYLFRVLERLNEHDIQILNYNTEVEEIHLLPDGAFHFYEASNSSLNYTLQINDRYYYQYHRNNAITKIGVILEGKTIALYRSLEGQIGLADLINKAYFRKFFPDVWPMSGIQYMPVELTQEGRIKKILSLVSAGIFPMCLALLLPVFMYSIVLEKEEKLIQIMKMNGMRIQYYWIMNFVFDFALYFITVVVFVLFGCAILELPTFTDTSAMLQILLFVGWGYCQISMAFICSVFLNKAQTATIVGYMASLWLTVVAVSLNASIYEYPTKMPLGLDIIPTFAFARVYYVIAYGCGMGVCMRTMDDLDAEVQGGIGMMYFMGTILIILAIYLNEVIPQDYGVARHPLFFIKDLIDFFRKKRIQSRMKKGLPVKINHKTSDDYSNNMIGIPQDAFNYLDFKEEDEDTRIEREMVYSLQPPFHKYPLILKNLRKVYKGINKNNPKIAVKHMCLSVRKGEMFGLLGPNGAGKTTIISMLTGLYMPSGGNAWVAGYDIRSQLDMVQIQMGVCPQFDILWPDLTVEEHLLFYARLKGISPALEKQNVEKAMDEVFLLKFRNFKTKELSGGMKRRLSVAISLVGNPKIVFLDEPTTGLDPENRRQLWDILCGCRGDKAMVLTTHSMEEADVLCSRIGIMTEGSLKCIGTQLHLKAKFGGGYHLFINCYQEKYLKILKMRKRSLRKSQKKIQTKPDAVRAEETKKGESIRKLSNPRKRSTSINQIMSTHRFSDHELLRDIGALNITVVHSNVQKYIQRILPTSTLLQSFNGNFIYEVPVQGFNPSKLFKKMERNKKKLLIADWGISQCSLEDVFTKLVLQQTSMD